MPRRTPKTSTTTTTKPSSSPNDIQNDTSPLLPPPSPSPSSSSSTSLTPGSISSPSPPIITGTSFTPRGILVGLAVGLVICFSNMYFGLQTGWVSTMTMPASLMGFGIFRLLSQHLSLPFSPVENVLVQTVAGSMAIMPLGCGFVGVMPAMNYLLKEEEMGPVRLSLGKMVLWGLGLCYFGVVFAVPLRRQVVIRERLRFPSGFSTAVLIGVLHGEVRKGGDEGFAGLVPREGEEVVEEREGEGREDGGWKKNVRLLGVCFLVSGVFTFATYFVPVLRNIPVFGSVAASAWLWTLNPSLAYVGQGIIMGPATTLHMLLGAVVGWGVLSPLAKYKGWAPAPVEDWEHGSKGWIVWVSLAIMLADSVVSLGYLALRSSARFLPQLGDAVRAVLPESIKGRFGQFGRPGYTSVSGEDDSSPWNEEDDDEKHEDDAPADQQISDRVVGVGLVLSIVFCIACIHICFGDLVPLYATVTAVFMALVLSIMGVRALGETDLNPVSGISKLAQLFFAFIIPQSNRSSVLINLVAGAVSEAGALQAGDLMQDLKTGHLLGAAPKAQFWGQVIGATVGAVVSAFIYKLYTAVYQVPGDLFQVPTGYVWIFTARLVTGEGLPPMAREWAIGSAALFSATTVLRIFGTDKRWQAYIPGGIAVAVGMYNVPSFTLARTIGGVLAWWWRSIKGWQDTPLIVLASGFILGEGFLSIVNLIMQSIGVPHL
ncbi:OPT oligopeptide transporter protein-domain-containing protein [Podospora aff. communis PSN243]|uniref:OPT oligopeptide transporter protein-domain-containing protein n=1 Tax=Podospora aff. communis PSN243 TaxID=3040156 RepID=A0AAV9H696_9PEZI|nr:OPT oligopeptide transporter protein-domain-containing protein [Podospora aff. communis PSN243]